MVNKKINKFKKIIASLMIAIVMLNQSAYTLVIAQEVPSAPSTPSAPETPEVTITPPETPETPEATVTPPVAPETPDTPTLDEYLNPSPTPTPKPKTDSDGGNHWRDDDNDYEGNTGSSTDEVNTGDESTDTNDSGSGHQEEDGNTGDSTITTGDSTNTATVKTDGNTNSAVSSSDSSSSGTTIVNDGNGEGSTNTGSATIKSDELTSQDNGAHVVNDLNQSTTTGDNSTSHNTGGDSTITSGDANTSGTAITSVNTNLDGVAVYEFNIVDSQNEDYILDFSDPTYCVSGCTGDSTTLANTGNGAGSENTANLDVVDNDATFQNNDADVENNLTLSSVSGENNADANTGGNSSITTGDANVSANALTFANNNFSGEIVYATVNIYGDLVGDIILPDGTVVPYFIADTTLANIGNGAGSTNTVNYSDTTNDTTNQFNDAEIDNNLVLYANTGDNDTNGNTGGNTIIQTGEASIIANIINFANNNIIDGDWWLVIVNEGGKWIGKIVGSDGGNIFGSDGFVIETNENGEVVVSNSGNGADSTNTANYSSESNNVTDQTNTAKVENNIDLTANTGGNSTSHNTNGDNSITTGDANIIANIVNFVNNNIVGSGRLLITVVNVFGSWIGNFVGPGHEKEANSDSNQAVVETSDTSSADSSQQSSTSDSSESSGDSSVEVSVTNSGNINISVSEPTGILGLFASSRVSSDQENEDLLALNDSVDTAGKKVVHVNLAWLMLIIPLGLVYIVTKRKIAYRHSASSSRANVK